MRAALEESAKKKEMSYEELTRIERGARRHYHDDITVVVMYLDHSHNSLSELKRDDVYDGTNAPIDIFSLS